MQVPPFMRYALLIDNSLEFKKPVTIATEGTNPENANIFVNNTIKVESANVLVEGFAYYGNSIKGSSSYEDAIIPRYNPSALPGYQKQPKATVPDFDQASFEHLATQYTEGDLLLSGHYELGTRDNPTIWYVTGKMLTTGPVTFSGYGIFLVSNAELKHDVTTLDDPGETTLAIYSDNNIKVPGGSLSISGQWFCNNTVELSDNTTFYGNITVGNTLRFKGTATMYYRPASPALTEQLWPMNDN